MKKQTAFGLLLFTLVVSPLETTAAPIPATGETIVNATIDGIQKNAATAMDDAGNSVIVWESGGYVYAQRFDSSGAAVGEETLVSTIPGAEPQVAMDPAGNFVVVWQQYGLRLFAQQFDNMGNKLGAELIVDETELECVQFDPPTGCFRYSGEPAVAVDADGNFVVVYGGVLLREGIFVFSRGLTALVSCWTAAGWL